MAWTYEQLFDALTDGDLNSQDSWSGNTLYDVQTSVMYQGAKAVSRSSFGTAGTIARTVTGVTAGSVYFAMRKDSSSQGRSYTMLGYVAEGAKIYIRMAEDGNLAYYRSGAYQTLTTYNADQWYVLNVEIDTAGHPDEFRIRVHDGSSWGAFTAWGGGLAGFPNIDQIIFDIDSTGGTPTAFWDTITPTDPTAGPPAVPMKRGGMFFGA